MKRDVNGDHNDDVDCPWLPEAERSMRATLLAGLTFVYRRPLDEEEEQNAAAGSGTRAGGGGRRSGGSVGGPSMDNLRTLCAVADAQTRFVIASAGGELVEMSEDKVRSSYHPVHLLWGFIRSNYGFSSSSSF